MPIIQNDPRDLEYDREYVEPFHKEMAELLGSYKTCGRPITDMTTEELRKGVCEFDSACCEDCTCPFAILTEANIINELVVRGDL